MDDFFKVSAALMGLGALGTFLNMVCRWLLGRLLTPEQYGEMETVTQVGGYVAVPLSALSVILVREVAYAWGEKKPAKLQALIWTLGRLVVAYAFLGMVLMLALSPFIRDWFHFNSIWPVVATSTICMSGSILVIISGTLQGSHRFWQSGLMGACGPVAKIGFSWVLITAGFGATGAVAALSAANIVMSIVGLFFMWRVLIPWHLGHPGRLRGYFRVFTSIALTLWLATLFGGIDMFFVKRVFSSFEAGNYARVSALVKLALFVNGTLTIALFPWVASEQAGGRETVHVLAKALAAGVCIAIGCALAFTAIPGFLLGLFYGDVTPTMIGWTRLMGWAMIPGSLFAILIQYFMARQEYAFLKWLTPAAVFYALLLMVFRHSIPALIVAMGCGTFSIVVGLTVQSVLQSKRRMAL